MGIYDRKGAAVAAPFGRSDATVHRAYGQPTPPTARMSAPGPFLKYV